MSFPAWKGLWDWSMRYQDGTKPSSWTPDETTPERMAWLQEALKHYMRDFAERMKEIKKILDEKGDEECAIEDKELLLDELLDIVASIDQARDLHKIGGLSTLLSLLQHPAPSIRWRAAEVVATCCSHNPPVQQWFLAGGVVPVLMPLLADPDPVVAAKAVLAVSSLVRHCTPGLAAVREAGGLRSLLLLLAASDEKLKRKVLYLLQYVLSRRHADAELLMSAEVLPHVLSAVQPAQSSDLRQAALTLLQEMTGWPAAWRALVSEAGLLQTLEALHNQHMGLSLEDRMAEAEELELIQNLQQQLSLPEAPPAKSDELDEENGQPLDANGQRHSSLIEVQGTAANNHPGAQAGGHQGQGVQQSDPRLALGMPLIPHDPI